MELGLSSAYQALARQSVSGELLTEEDLMLIELEALATINVNHSATTPRATIDQAAQEARDKLHNSFAAFRRARLVAR
jgi:hypothetical protein